MTQPATGDVWSNAYGFDSASAHKALYGSVLLRDQDGVNTSLAFVETDGVWQSGFNPFAADGQFRLDLLVEQGGTWYDLGAGTTKGPSFKTDFDIKKEHIWQSRQTIRTDITSEEGQVMFGLAEQSSISDTLEMDLPLDSTPAKGTANYARKRPLELEGRIRQGLVFSVDKGGYYTCDVYPNLSIENIDDKELSPEELITQALTWGVQIDAFSGYSHARFRTGPGWAANPGPPIFSTTAPVATASAGGLVSVVFDAPTGPSTPFTYTVTKTTAAGVITTLAGSASGTTTITWAGTGLTNAVDYTFQVRAENAAGRASLSPTSNEVTGLT